MPSIRSRLAVEVAKRTFRPMFESFDVQAFRRRIARWEVAAPAPREAAVEAVELAQCEGDWIRPHRRSGDRVILYFPGGAWVLRSRRAHRRIVARIAHAANADALMVCYRLAPEDPYPAGLFDCVDAYLQLLEAGVPPERLVFGGDSAGGNLCLAALLVLRDHGLPLPAGAFTLSACTQLRPMERSAGGLRLADTDPMFPTRPGAFAQDPQIMYVAGDRALLRHPYVSPLNGALEGLCPLLLQVGSTERLLDDSTAFADKARTAGVDAEVEVWDDQIHVWHAFSLPESLRALEHLADFVRRCCP